MGALLLAAAAVATGGCPPPRPAAPKTPPALTVGSRPADPVHARPGQRVGELELQSVLELSSADERFGGLSGLTLGPDGTTLVAVSDRGRWVTARMRFDEQGRLAGLSGWRIGPLRDRAGRPLTGRPADAEAVSRDRDGSLLVAFEGRHRIWRYPDGLDSRPVPVPHPRALADVPHNGGLEAMEVLPDGRLLLVCEGSTDGGRPMLGWIRQGGQYHALSYVVSEGFDPTDLAALPGGEVLVLERSYTVLHGARARLRRIAAADIAPGARLDPPVIARIGSPLPVDNFEGLALRERPDGGLDLLLVSDDNFRSLQRTLLVHLRLPPASATPGQ